MKRFVGLSLLLSLLAPVPAVWGVDWTVSPSLSISQTYNDNIFATEADPRTDTMTVVSPSIVFSGRGASWTHSLSYTQTIESFWRDDDLDTISHGGSFRAETTLGPRLSLSLLERASYSPTTSTEIFPDLSSEPEQVRLRSFRSTTEIEPVFRLSERTELELPIRFLAQNFKEESLATTGGTIRAFDTYEAATEFNWVHRISVRDTLTPSATYSHFWFSASPQNDTVGGTLAWGREWNPLLTTTFGAGVSQTFVQDGGGRSTDFTGSASLEHTLERWELRESYVRTIVSGAGFGAALVTDTGSASVTWAPIPDWGLTGSAGFFHAASNRPGTDVTINGFFTSAGLGYEVTRLVTAGLSYGYRWQDGGGSSATSFSRHLAGLTLSVISPSGSDPE